MEQLRRALVIHTTSRGLDPTVPIKASGVGWLGDIPAHWEVVRSKRLFRKRDERATKGDVQLTASQQHGVIPQAEFVAKEGRRVVEVITGSDILKHVDVDDFVISMRSFQGGLEWSKHSGAISSAYVAIVPGTGVVPAFFVHLFKSPRYIEALQSTSNLVRDGQALRFDNFAQVDLPTIPIEEQVAIASFLEKRSQRIDELVADVRSAIVRLNDLRMAALTAAVTGQIDVREEVA